MPMPVKRKNSRSINFFVSDKYADRIEVLKMRKGGITAFFEKCLAEADITEDEIKAMKLLRK